MGKAYANKKIASARPVGDYYCTPRSLVWVIKDILLEEFSGPILEPCCGEGAISQELKKMGFEVVENDLHRGGVDYLTAASLHNMTQVVTNPPFSLWDDFVKTAKKHCDKFMFIGRTNYFGTHERNVIGQWKNLKRVLVFDRYVDYQTPLRDDGLFCVGAMATGWFLWDTAYTGKPTLEVIDVQKYAKLGLFNKSK